MRLFRQDNKEIDRTATTEDAFGEGCDQFEAMREHAELLEKVPSKEQHAENDIEFAEQMITRAEAKPADDTNPEAENMAFIEETIEAAATAVAKARMVLEHNPGLRG